MKKRLSIILVGTAVTVVVAVGAFAGIIAAQSNDDAGRQTFVERVASILGVDSDTVGSAFKQAKAELHTERVDAKFAGLVESGTLTQEEADAIKAWQESKPEIEFNFDGKDGDSDGDGKHGWGRRGFGKNVGMFAGSEAKLDYLVEQGVITQADADSLTAWWDSRPEALDDLKGDRDGKRGDGKRGRHGWKGDKNGGGAGASKDDIDA